MLWDDMRRFRTPKVTACFYMSAARTGHLRLPNVLRVYFDADSSRPATRKRMGWMSWAGKI